MVTKRLCRRCLGFKWLKGRGLCETCWKVARADGFEHYPTREEVDPKLLCHCVEPIREPIPAFDAVQCKRCGRKVL